MASARPLHSLHTDRERVAVRARRTPGASSPRPKPGRINPQPRNTHTQQPGRRPRRTGGGCNSLLFGLGAITVIAGVVLMVLMNVVTARLERFESTDVRPTDTPIVVGVALADAEADVEVSIPNTIRNPFNVLLMGVDSRENPEDGVRSDTLIVVHVNPEEKWASMLSIPRDSVAQIPHLGQTKINAAYTFGYQNAADIYGDGTRPADAGAALAAETVEQFLDIKIHYMAQVDFQGFERLVDTFGGLMIDVPQPLLDPEYPTEDFGYERIYIPAGLQVLDGKMALRYARSRHNSSDFDRSCRQQRVLKAMLREVRQRDILDQVSLLPEVVEDVEQSVATTMPLSNLDVLRMLAELAQSLSQDRVLQFSINPSNVQILAEGDASSASNIYWNDTDIALLVERMMEGPDAPEDDVPMVQVLNGAGVRGLATRVTSHLSTQGFRMVEAADAPGDYDHSLIIDYTGQPESRQRLANLLGIEAEYVQAEPDEDAPPAPYNTDIVLIVGADYREAWTMIPEDAPAAPPPVPAATMPEEEVPNLPPGCNPDY